MNAKKKPSGTKAQVKSMKEKERRTATAIFLAFILLIVVLSAYFTYTFLNQPQNQPANPMSSQLKAAIVDQLSLTFPNQSFIETATSTLERAGYNVDYYPGEMVTVDFYKSLAAHEYSLVILRAHSALQQEDKPPVTLFTSEVYSRTKYVNEQLTDQLWEGELGAGFVEGHTYFAISPGFVQHGIGGRFRDTVIIAMGCNGLTYTDMAEAFRMKGAKAYISWNGSVSASHTDQATTLLLQHLVTTNETIEWAVDNTMKETGPDPTCNSQLSYYPSEAGGQYV